MKPVCYLVSAVVASPDNPPDIQLRAFRHHLELAAPLIAQQGGTLLRETGDRILVRFAKPVHAVLCAVRIQQAHRQSEDAPRPPFVRMVVFGSEFDGAPEDALLWASKWVSSAAAGEIRISESIAAVWREQGNRDLMPLPRDSERNFSVFLVRWQGPSREPVRTVRRRGWVIVALLVLPSLILLVFSWMQPGTFTLPEANVWLVGPIWSDFHAVFCPNLHRADGRVLADSGFMPFSPDIRIRGRVKRITGLMQENGNRTLRVDVVDETSGLMEARIEIPCHSDPCTCLQAILDADMPRDTLQAPLQTACRNLLGEGAPAEAVDACVQEYAGLPPSGMPAAGRKVP